MLRTYKSIENPIFTLHKYVEHLVCQVWCNASEEVDCKDLLDEDFENIYTAYDWLNKAVNIIYNNCKTLNEEERADIREAFNINNRLEELCSGHITPIQLSALPTVVENDIKPLLVKFYNELLDLGKVPGDKLDYYNKLLEANPDFKFCPCCGLTPIESAETHYREDNDHYLPKAEYPFASVNFQNLVPLCSKCNKKCKSTKNPFESGRVSFFAYDKNHVPIRTFVSIGDSQDLDYAKFRESDVIIDFDNDPSKTSTWDWLFQIRKRYNEEIRDFSKTELRIIANRLYKNQRRKVNLTYEEVLEDKIEDYSLDLYRDRNFLKHSFLQSIKNKPEWISAYPPIVTL